MFLRAVTCALLSTVSKDNFVNKSVIAVRILETVNMPGVNIGSIPNHVLKKSGNDVENSGGIVE